MRCGGVILCGGQSTRMGQSKADLPFGSEPMLARLVRCLREVVSPIVIVAAVEQVLPSMPADVILARDAEPGRGPLMGLASGLAMLSDQADAVFVTGCDTPLLAPRFISSMLTKLGDHDVAVPSEHRRLHPLSAVYRVNILPQIQALLGANCLRMTSLLELVRTFYVPVEELRMIDPDLHSLLNLNHPADYEHALRIAGLQ